MYALPGPRANGIPVSGPLQVNPAGTDQCQRSHRDEEPEKNSLKEWSNSDFAERLHGEPGSNQVKRDGQADAPKVLEHWIRGLEDVNVGVGDRSEEHTSELQSLRHLVCRLL